MKKVLVVLIVCCLLVCLLSGCVGEVPKSIRIVDGSILTSYNIDEDFPIAAQIIAEYTGGFDKLINVSADMVEGFDTSTATGDAVRTMTITYKNKSVSLDYIVLGDVNTPIRLQASVQNDGNDTYTLTLSLKNCTETDGAYAFSTILTYPAEIVAIDSVQGQKEGWTLGTREEAGSVRILYYDAATSNRIVEDTIVLTLKVTKLLSVGLVTLTFGASSGYNEISEGSGMKYLPEVQVEI